MKNNPLFNMEFSGFGGEEAEADGSNVKKSKISKNK